MLASLPMYDLPALHGAHDRFWQGIRNALGYGPETLTRTGNLWDHWQAPDLLLSQTCGFPYRAHLHDKVQLVASPDFGLDGCPEGYYNSVFLTRRADGFITLEEVAGKRFAFNEAMSQSGWAAPKVHLDSLDIPLGSLLQTGAHALSAAAVAEGRADFASLDAQTWRLLEAHTPLGEQLAITAHTEPTPALPYITASGQNAGEIRTAMAHAIAGLVPADRAALGLKGLVTISSETYLAVSTPEPPQI
jgi:ABC-type phosphate/phosphonate transport system substrate-binding protein